MENKYFQNIKFLSITFLIFSLMPFVVPQAFAGAPPSIVDPTIINSVVVEPGESTSSIVVTCTNPTVTGASIDGNLLEIDDSPDFSSVDVSKSGLTCDGGFTNNIINTPFLTDLKSYYVKLTVFTDIPSFESSNVYFEPFVQPDGGIIILKDRSPGLYKIQFRDIGVTNNIGPDIAFTAKPATLIVTDHNANIDLSTAEKINVKINGVDTVQEETGANTGIFTGPIPPGVPISYDPGVLGVARATIEIHFDVVDGDPDVMGDIIIEDIQLSDDQIASGVDGITPVNHPFKISFDNGGMVEDGTDISVEISWADADLSLVDDSDIGLPLLFFAVDEMFFDADGTSGLDVGETVYKDLDGDSSVSIGDIRLANAATVSYPDGSIVASGDSDEENTLTPFPFESYYDANTSGTFDVGETVYSDLAFDGSVGIADIRLANAATISFADGSSVLGADDPLSLLMYYASPGSGYEPITQPSDTDKYNVPAKTVKSNTCILSVCNTKEGKYILGYDLGSGGGGGGGISKAGFVVNALAGLGGLSSTGGGDSPPSFGPSSFAIISGDG